MHKHTEFRRVPTRSTFRIVMHVENWKTRKNNQLKGLQSCVDNLFWLYMAVCHLPCSRPSHLFFNNIVYFEKHLYSPYYTEALECLGRRLPGPPNP